MTDSAFHFERAARSPRALVVVALIWAVLALAYLRLDAAPWILGIFALATLPAIWEMITGTRAGLDLDGQRIHWFSGRRALDIPLDQIRAARFDTRLDLSVRVTLLLTSGQRLRLPFEATPPHAAFEARLIAQGIPVERHHFSLLG